MRGWVLSELKRNPLSRRLLVTAWAPGNAQRSDIMLVENPR